MRSERRFDVVPALWLAGLPMLAAIAGGLLDERRALGFTTWRAACRTRGLALPTLVDFTLQLLPIAVTGLLLGGLVVLAAGIRARATHARHCLAAHAGCALTLPLALLLCAGTLPLPLMWLTDFLITALAAWLLLRLANPAPRAGAAHP
jgi:hypothetical protein